MARYMTRRRPIRSDDDYYADDFPLLPEINVPDHEVVDTGLIDASGDAILRQPNPMGFGRHAEW